MLPSSSLVLLSILLTALLYVRAYQELYWLHPAIFILVTLIGVISALFGGFLLGSGLHGKIEDRDFLCRSLFWSGAFIALLGILIGALAVSLAAAVATTGYWGEAPYEYSGDYLIMGYQMLAFQSAILPTLLGSFLVGLGRKRAT